ncbi:MAG TPA: hypothetical protein VN414_10490, partial [Methanosarcina sp.]|nr:hypothetical protein [Methanosarcina sp.]
VKYNFISEVYVLKVSCNQDNNMIISENKKITIKTRSLELIDLISSLQASISYPELSQQT